MKRETIKILTINGGSSSIKFALFETGEKSTCKYAGKITRIGAGASEFSVSKKEDSHKVNRPVKASNFNEAAIFLLDWLEKQTGFGKIEGIGHRVVHGMQHTHSEIISDELMKELNQISSYDPDHLPAEIEIIRLCRNRYPSLMQVACFDTAFHTAMPRVAKILPIPRRFDRAGIQRYGFHGLSFTYLMEVLKHKGDAKETKGRVILAHLGSGASLAAVKDGKNLDTSMGFTTSGGLVMGTRCGDLDPGVAWYMMQNEDMTTEQFNHLINHESGLLGLSETSSDMLDLLRLQSTDIRAVEAVGLFCYQVKKWIGAFTAVLGGLDTLVFSGGIGENAPDIRSRICEGLEYLGIELNEEQNHKNALLISAKNSPVKIRVIPTDEESVIARSTAELHFNKIKSQR
jgi:acetate kinase